ncbi:hypothetical protein L7F22_045451 [Adiantum nelumboides]|nr:hypothetical protein [Adiantum nelumboides]
MVAGFYNVQNSTLGTNFPQTEGGEQVVSLLPSLALSLPHCAWGRRPRGNLCAWCTRRRGGQLFPDAVHPQRSGHHPSHLEAQRHGPSQHHLHCPGHRARRNVGMMRLQVDGIASGASAVVTDVLDGQGAQRTQAHHAGQARTQKHMIFSTVQPNWVNNVTAWMFSALQPLSGKSSLQNTTLPASVASLIAVDDAATATQSYAYSGAQQIDVWKAVGVATSDSYAPQEKRVAVSAASEARQAAGMPSLASTRRRGSASGARVATLCCMARVTRRSDCRPRQEPVSFTSSPTSVRAARVGTITNAQEHQRPGAIYPWVSARFQNATGIGPTYDYEYHLNNDIALLHWQYYQQTHNRSFLARQAWPIMSRVAAFWSAQVEERSDGQFHTTNLTDPDEYANHVDDGAFTNAGIAIAMTDAIDAARILGRSEQVPSNWSDIADRIAVLRDNSSNIILEFDGFDGAVIVKQADVPLLIYPLEFHTRYPAKQPAPIQDLQYHAAQTSANGPGMTYSIYGIASAELSRSGSWTPTPTTTAPTGLHLLTGHGGLLQMYTHGFAGYRSRTDRVYLDPSLPPQLAPKLSVKGIKYGSSVLDVDIGSKTTTVTHRSGQAAVVVEIAKRNANAGNYTIPVGGSIRVATTRPSDANRRNLAACQSISASRTATGGNYLVGAIDGSNGTYYQPDSTDPTEVVIDLSRSQRIENVHVNFARLPAANVSVLTSNDNRTYTARVENMAVDITVPYDAQSIVQVKIPSSTRLTLLSSMRRATAVCRHGTSSSSSRAPRRRTSKAGLTLPRLWSCNESASCQILPLAHAAPYGVNSAWRRDCSRWLLSARGSTPTPPSRRHLLPPATRPFTHVHPSKVPRAAMSSNWEVRFSNSRQLPYFYNGASGVSVWERPEEISEEQVASLPGAQLLNATNGGNSGGEAGGQVRASHLLVKHKGSRRPSSWKEVSAADKATWCVPERMPADRSPAPEQHYQDARRGRDDSARPCCHAGTKANGRAVCVPRQGPLVRSPPLPPLKPPLTPSTTPPLAVTAPQPARAATLASSPADRCKSRSRTPRLGLPSAP